MSLQRASQSSNLAEILEKILDKGIVVAGDIKINLADVELLTIKIRLVICSVERAMEMGINWWQNDPNLSSNAQSELAESEQLRHRVKMLESELARLEPPAPENTGAGAQQAHPYAPGERRHTGTRKTFGFNLEEKRKEP